MLQSVSRSGREPAWRNMTEGKIWKQILLFSLPLFCSSVLQQIYNMVDVWFVGNYVGSNAIAAIGGATTTCINMSISLFNGFSSAIAVIIGQKFGAGRKNEVIRVIQNALIISTGVGVVLSFFCVAAAPWILKMCNVPAEVMDMAVSYLQIYFGGSAAVFLYNVGAGILRAMGDSRRTLYVLMLCCLINVVGDWIAVTVLGLGVTGAAAATVAAQCISAFVTLYLLLNRKSEFTFPLSSVRPDGKIQKSIVRMAVPCSAQNMLYSVANLIFQTAVNGYGAAAVAAVSLYNRADMVCWWAAESFSLALTTVVAQNYGAGKKERIRQSVHIGLFLAAIAEILFTVILMAGGNWYFSFFTDNREVIEAGVHIVWIVAPFYITYVLLQILGGMLRGIGDTFGPMVITLLGICALRIAWVLGVGTVAPGDFQMVLYNYPVTWITTSAVFVIYYIKRRKKFE